MKYKSRPSPLALSIVCSHRNHRFMDDATVTAEARKLDARCVSTMTPNPHKMITWRPKVRVTRHYLFVGALRLKLTGLTGSEQYALLWAKCGCWKLANKLQAKFNAQFDRAKRLSTWTPGKVLT